MYNQDVALQYIKSVKLSSILMLILQFCIYKSRQMLDFTYKCSFLLIMLIFIKFSVMEIFRREGYILY